MPDLRIIEHPLIAHSMTALRDRNTSTLEFRQHAAIVSKILLVEATRHLTLTDRAIETPLESTTAQALADQVVVVPVLRAGLAMLFAAQDFLPDAPVGFLGLERDEQTALAREYYQKLPRLLAETRVLVIDPMLATGGSLDATIAALKEKQATAITTVCIVAAPEGVRHLEEHHPDVPIITAALDRELNDAKFILPGLGDFGDRYFGT